MTAKSKNGAIKKGMQDIHQLVRLCQEGHLDAFDTLFTHYQQRVFDLAYIIVGDDMAAEDMVQETFLSVFQKIDSFRGEAAFETWLTSITVNQCRMYQRRQKVRQFFSLEQLSPRRLLHLSDRQQDVPELVDSRQKRLALWEMVDQLDERLRLPMILRYRYVLPCGEIAFILDLRTSTVYQQLNEGRRLLARMQEQQSRSTPAVLTEPTS